MLKITLTSGLVGKKMTQRKIVEALGLGKFGSSAIHSDSPTIRGMLNKVHHLVSVTPAEGHEATTAKAKLDARAAARKPLEHKEAQKASSDVKEAKESKESKEAKTAKASK